jgi:hypothetical protein
MRMPFYSAIVGLALLVSAGQPGTRVDAQQVSVTHDAPTVVVHETGPDGDGLVLTAEMLFGGLVLIAGSAYALRRSRR